MPRKGFCGACKCHALMKQLGLYHSIYYTKILPALVFYILDQVHINWAVAYHSHFHGESTLT